MWWEDWYTDSSDMGMFVKSIVGRSYVELHRAGALLSEKKCAVAERFVHAWTMKATLVMCTVLEKKQRSKILFAKD